jgi:hypothetical protein
MKEMLLDSCKEDSAKKEKKRINNNPLLNSFSLPSINVLCSITVEFTAPKYTPGFYFAFEENGYR